MSSLLSLSLFYLYFFLFRLFVLFFFLIIVIIFFSSLVRNTRNLPVTITFFFLSKTKIVLSDGNIMLSDGKRRCFYDYSINFVYFYLSIYLFIYILSSRLLFFDKKALYFAVNMRHVQKWQ